MSLLLEETPHYKIQEGPFSLADVELLSIIIATSSPEFERMEKVNVAVEFERRFEREELIDVFYLRNKWESHHRELNGYTLYLYQCSLEWAFQWFGKIPNKKVRPMTYEEVDRIFWQEIQWTKQKTNTNEGVAE